MLVGVELDAQVRPLPSLSQAQPSADRLAMALRGHLAERRIIGSYVAMDLNEHIGYHASERCKTCGHTHVKHRWREWTEPCGIKDCLCDRFELDADASE